MTKTKFITEGTYSGDGKNCRWINLDEPLEIELGQRVEIKVIPLNDKNKEIKPVKNSKIGDKVTIDGIEGYVLEVDDAGEPTVLCSEILGEMSWHDAMEKANEGLWHLPTVDEFKKYYEIVRELDSDWYGYWTSIEDDSFYVHFVSTYSGNVFSNPKTYLYYVRAFAFVGSKKNSRPRSWEEYCQNAMHTPCFRAISGQSSGKNVFEGNRYTLPEFNDFNTEKEAKSFVVLGKLIQLRDAWWGNWEPNWKDNGTRKFIIICEKGVLVKSYNFTYQRTLAFPTEKMRNEFLDTFRDLIEEAKTLI